MTLAEPAQDALLSAPALQGLEHALSCAAGVDEVGRGPLAGPVVAAAVLLDHSRPIDGLRDSKKLTEAQRERLAAKIVSRAAAYAVARAEVAEIDRLNILQASLLAMRRAVSALAIRPRLAYVDGNRLPALELPAIALVKGDDRLASIAAASILAKVARDREMRCWERCCPGYGFAQHKGYGTREHLAALDRLGPCAVHRLSFAPVANRLRELEREPSDQSRWHQAQHPDTILS